MKKYLVMTLACLFIGSSLFAMGNDRGQFSDNKYKYNNGDHGKKHGGSNNGRDGKGAPGTPEPASMLLLLAGGLAAYGTKKIIKKK